MYFTIKDDPGKRLWFFMHKPLPVFTNMLFENAKAREVEERGLLGGKGDYQLDVALGGSNEGA